MNAKTSHYSEPASVRRSDSFRGATDALAPGKTALENEAVFRYRAALITGAPAGIIGFFAGTCMLDLKRAHETTSAIIGMFEHGLLQRITVRADNEAAKMSACLTLSIFEQFHTAMKLSGAGLASHAAGPTRSMLAGRTTS